MKTQPARITFYVALFLFVISVVLFFLTNRNLHNSSYKNSSLFADAGEIKSMDNGTKWTRSFRHTDGSIYLKGNLVSTDGGKTIHDQTHIDVEEINSQPECAVLSTSELFYAIDGPTSYVSTGIYRGKSWRSSDNMKTLKQEEPVFYIPDGIKPRKDVEKWFGLFVYRTILEMPDGKWLMTMYGNFESDTIVPSNNDAAEETQFMMRTIIVTSDDKGLSWKYLSTVASPVAGEAIGEGFVEPALTLLEDGRLLCIMRTGHFFPLYASWSSDSGQTWTLPQYTGIDRGCDPCLITLHDGRVALSWGRRFPEGWSLISAIGDKSRFVYPGEGYTSLSISDDGGLSWNSTKIIQKSGSCYSTIIEVESGIIFMQSDQWYCRIRLNPVRR